MTISEVHAAVAAAKPCTQRTVQRYIADLKISPLGVRQRPQQYPEDTAQRILQHLGLAAAPLAPEVTAATLLGTLPRTRLVSNKDLAAARPLPRSKTSTKGKK